MRPRPLELGLSAIARLRFDRSGRFAASVCCTLGRRAGRRPRAGHPWVGCAAGELDRSRASDPESGFRAYGPGSARQENKPSKGLVLPPGNSDSMDSPDSPGPGRGLNSFRRTWVHGQAGTSRAGHGLVTGYPRGGAAEYSDVRNAGPGSMDPYRNLKTATRTRTRAFRRRRTWRSAMGAAA